MKCITIRLRRVEDRTAMLFDVQNSHPSTMVCLSDLEIERQCPTASHSCRFSVFRIRFQILGRYGYSENAWQRLEKDKLVWAELQRQLDAMGLQVKRGTIQDATFIEADPDHRRNPTTKVPRLDAAEIGTWTKKGKKSYFGYKLHQKNRYRLQFDS